jgi:plastocyanin
MNFVKHRALAGQTSVQVKAPGFSPVNKVARQRGFSPGRCRQRRQNQIERKMTMTKQHLLFTSLTAPVIIAALLFLAGSPTVKAADQPAAANVDVKVDNLSFMPRAVTVPVGTTITWTNRDDIPHTAVSTTGIFKSKILDTDDKFSYTFTKAGTYPYYCTIHPKMTGTVVVR